MMDLLDWAWRIAVLLLLMMIENGIHKLNR
jgi:hypothetical protein